MENLDRVEILKKVLELEKCIAEAKEKLKTAKRARFRSVPVAPKRTEYQKTEIPIKPTIKYNWIIALIPLWAGAILLILGGILGAISPGAGLSLNSIATFLGTFVVIWPIIYYFAFYKQQRKKNIEDIRISDAYRAECAAAEEERKKKQAEADDIYQRKMDEYNNITMPAYHKEKAEWQAKKDSLIHEIEVFLKNKMEELENIYASTKIVPLPYRKIDALQYIYHVVATSSDYSIKEAIDMYERQEQKKLDEEKIREQQEANRLARERTSATNVIIEQQESENSSFGILRGMVGAIKDTHSTYKNKKDENDLWGTAMCPYGKRSRSGIGYIHCDISCPLHYKCTHR